jgi:lactate dehydrogenase-like 2-hydroxyacid dehydrogenase
MAEAIVCTEPEFRKGEKVFTAAGRAYRWVVSPPAEEAVAEALQANGARIVVLGVARYAGPLYAALAEQARSGPALIARYGVGYDGVDLARCRELNIIVANTPGTLDVSVAEHALALALSLARWIPALDAGMRRGEFSASPGMELAGRRLGVAGFGAIGRRLALTASRGLGMRVLAFDTLTVGELAAREGLAEPEFLSRYGLERCTSDFAEFAAGLDILSIHLPVTAGTRHFFDASRLALLRPGVLLINTGRGALVDEAALFDVLSSGRLAAAALDVFETEPYVPVAPDKDLRRLANVVLTPHVASNTAEANRRIQAAVLGNIRCLLAGDHDGITRVG